VLRGVCLPLVAAVTVATLACGQKRVAAPIPDGGIPFEAAAPRVYVAKVKNLLIGLPPSAGEVAGVEKNPAALGALVDGWMARPEYRRKMLRFFQLAFQQTQIGSNDFLDQVYAQVGLNPTTTPRLLDNLQESFARTALALIDEGRPFTEVMTTRRVMMTTATKELYAFLDLVDIDNEGLITDRYRLANRTIPIYVGSAPVPLAETLDPTSPNYMHWYDPDVAGAYASQPECQQDPIILTPLAISLHYLMLGTIDARKLQTGVLCPRIPGTPRAAQLTDADFDDWTMVTIRQPNEGEPTTPNHDLLRLRKAQELVLVVPRVGFFSTPAFFANWPTNVSNQMRATIHQTLIVATGKAIDGMDATDVPETPGLDSMHSRTGDCLGCHRLLDPTRSIFSASWSWHYRRQVDPVWQEQLGRFAFAGVNEEVRSLDELGAVLAKHPRVAPGWVQKLCHYLDSAPCDESDPEFGRLVALFRASNHSWKALVKALVTSPLVTHAADSVTARQSGEVVAVARRDHLCAALAARLGLPDVCAAGAGELSLVVSGLPSDAYARGGTTPVLPNEPTLFFRAALENICGAVAAQVVDAPAPLPGARRWSSAEPQAAIADFVAVVMGLVPEDDRAQPARALLQEHFEAARQQPGISPTEALRSTFVAACLAPSAVSIGL
jgi:hypothetical protein